MQMTRGRLLSDCIKGDFEHDNNFGHDYMVYKIRVYEIMTREV